MRLWTTADVCYYLGIDVALILCVAMLLKDRKEKERYRHIDEKMGPAGFYTP